VDKSIVPGAAGRTRLWHDRLAANRVAAEREVGEVVDGRAPTVRPAADPGRSA